MLLATRVVMLLWAGSVALALRDSETAGQEPVASIWVGALIGLAWLLAGAWWAYLRTDNVHTLDGRFPSRSRSIAAWLYAPIWMGLMAATLVRATPHPEFDVRPIIIVSGFALTMMAPYRLVHRIFKSLLRMPPTASCVAFYVVDASAFGLLWWRATSWSSHSGEDLSFDIGVVVAVIVALVCGTGLTWYVDRSADTAQRTRTVALRTRHDHRIARLCGLDPMDPATRRALLLARQAAVRTSEGGPVDLEIDPLVTMLAHEIEGGVTTEFAERIRLLALRTDGLVVARRPDDDIAARPDDRPRRSSTAPRLYLAETLRYVVTGLYAVCALACLALVVGFERNDEWTVDVARTALVWGAPLAHVAAAAWATSVARGALRAGAPAVWRVPLGATIATGLVAALWIARDGDLGDGQTLVAFALLTVGLELALWRIAVLDDRFVLRYADSPLQAWMSIAPTVFGLLLISPVRMPLELDEPTGRVAFFATLVGLAAALSGSMAAISMVQLEDGIRASTSGADDPAAAPSSAADVGVAAGPRPAASGAPAAHVPEPPVAVAPPVEPVESAADASPSSLRRRWQRSRPAEAVPVVTDRVPTPPKPRGPGARTRKEAAALAAAALVAGDGAPEPTEAVPAPPKPRGQGARTRKEAAALAVAAGVAEPTDAPADPPRRALTRKEAAARAVAALAAENRALVEVVSAVDGSVEVDVEVAASGGDQAEPVEVVSAVDGSADVDVAVSGGDRTEPVEVVSAVDGSADVEVAAPAAENRALVEVVSAVDASADVEVATPGGDQAEAVEVVSAVDGSADVEVAGVEVVSAVDASADLAAESRAPVDEVRSGDGSADPAAVDIDATTVADVAADVAPPDAAPAATHRRATPRPRKVGRAAGSQAPDVAGPRASTPEPSGSDRVAPVVPVRRPRKAAARSADPGVEHAAASYLRSLKSAALSAADPSAELLGEPRASQPDAAATADPAAKPKVRKAGGQVRKLAAAAAAAAESAADEPADGARPPARPASRSNPRSRGTRGSSPTPSGSPRPD